jgi:23S rRNA pseudouridine955/2504/2580 synthase
MSRKNFYDFQASKNDTGRRVDRVARRLLGNIPLSRVYSALRKGDILLNGKKTKQGILISDGDVLSVHESLSPNDEYRIHERFRKENKGLDKQCILLENDNILIINKKPGIQVHGTNSLQQQVLNYLLPKISPSLSFSPGPLHRLDRNTSGIIVFGKSLAGAKRFSMLLRNNECRKHYVALLDGEIRSSSVWEDLLARDRKTKVTEKSEEGKYARTEVHPIAVHKKCSLCLFTIKTGITHQIRVQASIHGYPLRGDIKYGGSLLPGGYLLHAVRLEVPKNDPILDFEIIRAPLFSKGILELRKHFPGKPIENRIDDSLS